MIADSTKTFSSSLPLFVTDINLAIKTNSLKQKVNAQDPKGDQ